MARFFHHNRLCLLLALAWLGFAAPPLWAQNAPSGTFTLNLNDVDINALITTVARQTGKNFVVDPRVRAKVTVISSQAMTAAELYKVFLSVLQVHGYAAVEAGDVIKILPDVTAKQGPVPVIGGISALGDQLVTRVIPIKNINASQLVPILRPLVPQQGHLAAYQSSNIIVITDRASNINRLVDIINRIDRPDNEEIELIKLEQASASEVVRIINSLNKQGQNQNMPDAPQLAADDRTNSILVSGSKAARMRIRALVESLDSPTGGGGNTKVIYLKYAKAKDLVTVLRGVEQGQAKAESSAKAAPTTAAAAAKDAVDIQADEGTNALVITAPPDRMKSLEDVVRRLDIRRAQVHVEAIIAEITDDTARELGFSYVGGNKDKIADGKPIGAIGLGGGGKVLGEIATAAATGTKNAPSLVNGFNVLFGSQDSSGNVFGGIMRAIASDGANNILSTPSIVTLDNQEAEIIVGQNVPFVTGSYTTSTSGADNPFQTIQRQDVGIKLKILPQINDGDTIQLKIEQEVSDVFTESKTGQLITNKRNINTNVLVEDGQLLVLGGLIDDQKGRNIAKVPILGDIPLIGRLFQYRTSTAKKRNLMVFLHPTIIDDRKSADATSMQKYQYIRAKQLEASQRTKGLFQRRLDSNILPELELYFRPQAKAAPQAKKLPITAPAPAQKSVAPERLAPAAPDLPPADAKTKPPAAHKSTLPNSMSFGSKSASLSP